MATEFDPYHKWLGIAPEDQPPNYYQLLGLRNFESDLDVLEGAADRQMSHLRTFQSGKHSDLSQKLLNEVTNAKLCLLDPLKKGIYDERLRSETPVAPPAEAGSSPPPQAASPPPRKSPPAARSGSEASMPAISAAPTAGSQTIQAESVDDDEVLDATVIDGPAPRRNAPTGTGAVHPSRGPVRSSLPRRAPKRSTGFVILLVAAILMLVGVPVLLAGTAYLLLAGRKKEKPRPPIVARPGTPLPPIRIPGTSTTSRGPSVLKLRMSPEELAESEILLDGKLLSSQSLVSRAGAFEHELPPGNHKLEITRPAHEPYTQSFTLRAGSSNSVSPYWRPIARVSIRMPPKNRDRATIEIDGKPVTFTERSTVYVPVELGVHTLKVTAPGFEPFETSFAPTRGSVTSLTPDWTPAPGEYPAVKFDNVVDVSRNSMLVRWKKDSTGFVSPPVSPNTAFKLMAPYKPPRSYVLQATIERIGGNGPAMLHLVADGRSCPLLIDDDNQVLLGGYHGKDYTLVAKDAAGDILPTGKPVKVKCTVTNRSLQVELDGSQPVTFSETFFWFRGVEKWKMTLPDIVALGAMNAQFRFSDVELLPLQDGGSAVTVTVGSVDPEADVAITPGAGPGGDDAPSRAAVPDKAALTAARTRIANIFPSKPKTAAEFYTRAVELGKIAAKERDGTAAQYQLYLDASYAASQAGDVGLAVGFVDEMASVFDLDRLKGASFLLSRAGAKATTDARKTNDYFETSEGVIQQLIAEQRYAEAATLAGQISGHISRPPALVNTAKALEKHTAALAADYQQYTTAKKTLEADSSNAAAHLSVGKWLAFRRNNWSAALPHLAKGSDADIARIAQQSLNAPPATAIDMIARGDAWKKIADKSSGDDADHALLRAGYYWEMALPGATALERVELRKKMIAVEKVREKMPGLQQMAVAGKLPTGAWYDLFGSLKLPQGVTRGRWMQQGNEIASNSDSTCSLLLPVIVQGSYELETTFTTKRENGVGLVLPVAHRSVALIKDYRNPSLSLHNVTVAGSTSPAQVQLGILQPGVKQTLRVVVTINGEDVKISSHVNNLPPVDWSGKVADLSIPANYAPSAMMQPCLITTRTETLFHTARIKPLDTAQPQGPGATTPYIESLLSYQSDSYQIERDIAPAGARLAALEIAGDQYSFSGIQAVYQNGSNITQGLWFGRQASDSRTFTPRSGYAIGGFDVQMSADRSRMNRLRVVYMRRKSGGGLDTSDTYESEWFGRDSTSSYVTRISGNGHEIAGLRGCHRPGSSVAGIGVIVKRTARDTAVALPKSKARFNLAFDGRYSFVQTNLMHKPNSPVTIEAYLTPMASGYESNGVIAGHDYSYGGLQLAVHRGYFRFALAGPSRTAFEVYSDEPFLAGQQYHVAGVFDGKQVRMYVNGRLQMNVVQQVSVTAPASQPFGIGAALRNSTGFATRHYTGLIEQIHIANDAVYNRSFTPPLKLKRHPNSVLLHMYDEGSNSVIIRDHSGRNVSAKTVKTAWQKM